MVYFGDSLNFGRFVMVLVELPVASVWKAQGGKEALSAFSWDGWMGRYDGDIV